MNKKISASKMLALFFGCEYFFYLTNILKIPIDVKNKYLVIGSYVHDTISEFYKNIKLYEIKENRNNYKDFIYEKIIPSLPFDNKYFDTILDNIKGFIWWEEQRMIRYNLSYRGDFSNFLPIVNERKFYVNDLVGILDIVFKYGTNVHIKDWKTSNSSISKEEYEFQLRVYQYIYENTFNILIKSLSNVMTKTRKEIKFGRFLDNDIFIEGMVSKYHKKIEELGEDDDNWRMNGKYCAWCPLIDVCEGF